MRLRIHKWYLFYHDPGRCDLLQKGGLLLVALEAKITQSENPNLPWLEGGTCTKRGIAKGILQYLRTTKMLTACANRG